MSVGLIKYMDSQAVDAYKDYSTDRANFAGLPKEIVAAITIADLQPFYASYFDRVLVVADILMREHPDTGVRQQVLDLFMTCCIYGTREADFESDHVRTKNILVLSLRDKSVLIRSLATMYLESLSFGKYKKAFFNFMVNALHSVEKNFLVSCLNPEHKTLLKFDSHHAQPLKEVAEITLENLEQVLMEKSNIEMILTEHPSIEIRQVMLTLAAYHNERLMNPQDDIKAAYIVPIVYALTAQEAELRNRARSICLVYLKEHHFSAAYKVLLAAHMKIGELSAKASS